MSKRFIYLIVILTISIFVVFFDFQNFNLNVAHDESEIVRAALTLVDKPFAIFTPIADGHTTLYLYTILGSFRVFGSNTFAMRFPVAVCSILNIILLFLILVRVLKESEYRLEISLLASILMLTSHWFVNFARFSFEIPFLLTLELISLYFLLSYTAKQGIHWDLNLTFSAIFAGLAFNSYQPGRIFFLVPLFYLLINKYYKQIVRFLIVFGIIILPLSSYLLTNKSNDIRINQQLYFNNNKLTLNQKIEYFGENVVKNLGMFSFIGDNNGRHNYPGKPAINPILASLMYLGIFISLLNIRKGNYHKLFLAYFLVALFPTLLTLSNENPNMLRTYTMLPAIFYFIAVSLNAVFHIQVNSWRKYQKLIILLMLLLLVYSTYKELITYFIDIQNTTRVFQYTISKYLLV